MKFILGKKVNMSQKFLADGTVVPVTIVNAGPCYITQVKNQDKDGYQAIQLGCEKAKKLNKALKGHLKDTFEARNLKEFRLSSQEQVKLEKGQEITVNIFAKGDIVKVTGISKGKGFQGVVKRHGFKGAKTTHGTKDQVRHSGSIGAGGPQHVFKGVRMAGRMGGDQVTITNLEIVDIDPVNNYLFIKGAVPGGRNTLLKIVAPGEMDLTKKIEAETDKKVEPAEDKPKVDKEKEPSQETEAKDSQAKVATEEEEKKAEETIEEKKVEDKKTEETKK